MKREHNVFDPLLWVVASIRPASMSLAEAPNFWLTSAKAAAGGKTFECKTEKMGPKFFWCKIEKTFPKTF